MVGAITKLTLPTRAAFPHAVIWRNEVRDYQHQLLSDTQRHQFFIFLYFYCFSLFTFALLHLVLCLECDCFYWTYHIHAQCRGKWEWVLYVGQWFRSFSLEEVMISHISMKGSLMSMFQIWDKLLLAADKNNKFSAGSIAASNKIKLLFTGKVGESERWVYYFSVCHSSHTGGKPFPSFLLSSVAGLVIWHKTV